jgi:hypothetical protein
MFDGVLYGDDKMLPPRLFGLIPMCGNVNVAGERKRACAGRAACAGERRDSGSGNSEDVASREKSPRGPTEPCPAQPVRVSEFHFHLAREGSVQRNCRKHECVTCPAGNLLTINLRLWLLAI